jgi:RNA polymerase sigma factor (sigma-70 family)
MARMFAAEKGTGERQRLSDALRRVAQQDQSALEEVYAATHAKLFGICLRISKDREEAEDALQEVYVKVWRSAASFDPARGSPITWLATLARNRAIDNLRSSARSRGTEPIEAALNAPDPQKDAFSAASESQDHARLAHCIGQLNRHQSSAIRSAFLDGATYSQLAERGNVPVGTMKSWIRRGLMRLRDCLDQ